MTEDNRAPPIPPAMLDLIRLQWSRGMDSDLFASTIDIRPHVLGDPSHYLFTKGNQGVTTFTAEEAFALHDQGAFRGLSKVLGDGTLAVNENALHAAEDFMSRVSALWREYQKRLDMAREAAKK